jgi:hypothetical protein
LNITDYRLYRTDHPDNRAQGGTAIFIRHNIIHHLIPNIPTDFLQATSLSISTLHFSFTVSAVYCPSNKNISQYDFHIFLRSLGPKFIAGGDFNAKHPQWGCRMSNPRGTTLLNALSSTSHIVISPNQPTYWPTSLTKRPDILDYFIPSSSFQNLHSNITNLYDLSSDHSPVLIVLDTQPVLATPNPSLINGPVGYERFEQYFNGNIKLNIPLKTKSDIDEAVETITTLVQQGIWHSTVCQFNRTRTQNTLPTDIRSLITEKRRARAKWQTRRYL